MALKQYRITVVTEAGEDVQYVIDANFATTAILLAGASAFADDVDLSADTKVVWEHVGGAEGGG